MLFQLIRLCPTHMCCPCLQPGLNGRWVVMQAPGKDVNLHYHFGDKSKTKLGEGAFGVVRDWPGLAACC